MRQTIIPKSLHTVTAFSAVADYVRSTVGCDNETAMQIAVSILGYATVPDPYGLADMATKRLDKRTGHHASEAANEAAADAYHIANR